jgi:hypothetical protein
MGSHLISRTHPKSLILGLEACHGEKKEVFRRVQARSGPAGELAKDLGPAEVVRKLGITEQTVYPLGYRPPVAETIQWPPWTRDAKLLVSLT